VSAAQEIADARALFEKAEREADPEFKARALEEAIGLLASCDPDEITEAQARLISNVRLAHTRRLLVQLVGLKSVSLDAWFEYVRLLMDELNPEVERLTASDAELKENYRRFIGLLGPEAAAILRNQAR